MMIAGALLFATAETAAQAMSGEFGIMSAARVVEILAPEYFYQFREPMGLLLFKLPGWLLFGAPGVALAWKYRAIPLGGEEMDGETVHTTYEDIVAAAEEAEEWISNRPSKYVDLEDFDPTNPLLEQDGLAPDQPLESDALDDAIAIHEGLKIEIDETEKP